MKEHCRIRLAVTLFVVVMITTEIPAQSYYYKYLAEDQDVSFDPATGQSNFNVCLEIGPGPDCPPPCEGQTGAFGMSLGHDPNTLSVTEVVAAGVIGPDGECELGFLEVSLFPEGWTMFAIYLLIPFNTCTISYEFPKVVCSASYEATNLRIGQQTALEWTESFGVPNAVNIGGSNLPALGCDGEITFVPSGNDFVRGDCNDDGQFNASDPIYLLNFLFANASPPSCNDSCDANDSGFLNIADPVWLLSALFSGGPPPLPPVSECGFDLTPDSIGCSQYAGCP